MKSLFGEDRDYGDESDGEDKPSFAKKRGSKKKDKQYQDIGEAFCKLMKMVEEVEDGDDSDSEE